MTFIAIGLAEHAADDLAFATRDQVGVPFVRRGGQMPDPTLQHPLIDPGGGTN